MSYVSYASGSRRASQASYASSLVRARRNSLTASIPESSLSMHSSTASLVRVGMRLLQERVRQERQAAAILPEGEWHVCWAGACNVGLVLVCWR